MQKEIAVAEPIISVSGLRGIVGETLTPETAVRYVAAFASTLPPGKVVLAGDGRASGAMLAEAVAATLHAAGRSTIEAGVAPTPTVGVLVRQQGAVGGVQITASHNPAEYNGLKLFSAEGRVIPEEPGREVLARYRNGAAPWVTYDRLGARLKCNDPLAAHLEAVLATVDVEAIREAGFRVVLDANHGAGGSLGRLLLETLGCRLTVLGPEADGRFAHAPEPTAENLATVLPSVPEVGADVGFCQDPDADRLAVIDANGRYLGEEYTLALCVLRALEQQPGPIVTNGATSRMSEDLAEQHGQALHRSAVGEANVVDLMLQEQAVFGGEGNGGPIDPRVGLVRDSFVGMAQILDLMARQRRPVGELADALPRYAIVKTKIPLEPEKITAGLEALERRFADAAADRGDGLRLDWPDRWLLVRASNTEPIVRAISEASDEATARGLCDEAAGVLAEV
jgi:phosphomannomutase